MSPPDDFQRKPKKVNHLKLNSRTETNTRITSCSKEADKQEGLTHEETDGKSKPDKDLFLKVQGLVFDDLFDWSTVDSKSSTASHSSATVATMKGSLIDLNYKKIAVFRYDKRVFAVDEECPHLGGPLHLGDIETLHETNMLCIVCPWHKWRMEVTTGKVKLPPGRQMSVDVYPIKVDSLGSLWIAFSALDPKHFNEEFDF